MHQWSPQNFHFHQIAVIIFGDTNTFENLINYYILQLFEKRKKVLFPNLPCITENTFIILYCLYVSRLIIHIVPFVSPVIILYFMSVVFKSVSLYLRYQQCLFVFLKEVETCSSSADNISNISNYPDQSSSSSFQGSSRHTLSFRGSSRHTISFRGSSRHTISFQGSSRHTISFRRSSRHTISF